jgi:hypothetical protein
MSGRKDEIEMRCNERANEGNTRGAPSRNARARSRWRRGWRRGEATRGLMRPGLRRLRLL